MPEDPWNGSLEIARHPRHQRIEWQVERLVRAGTGIVLVLALTLVGLLGHDPLPGTSSFP